MLAQSSIRPSCSRPRIAGLLSFLAISSATTAALAQTNGSWNAAGGGNFGTAGNWLNSTIPANGGVATFGNVITGDATVSLNTSPTLGGITFDSLNAYTISAGGGTLTLSGNRRLDLVRGSHTINAPISTTGGFTKVGAGTLQLGGNSPAFTGDIAVNAGLLRLTSSGALGNPGSGGLGAIFGGRIELAASIDLGDRSTGLATTATQAPDGALRATSGNSSLAGDIFILGATSIGVDAGASLRITGEFIDNGNPATNGLTKVGAGTLSVTRFGGAPVGAGGSNRALSRLTVSAGTAQVLPSGADTSVSRLQSLSVSPGASFDLTDNRAILDYTGTSPESTVRQLLDGDQIITSTAGRVVGYRESSSFTPGLTSFAGQPVDGTSLLLVTTLPGDVDLNGTVDFADLVSLAQGYGQPGTWANGDIDYDGQVGFPDLVSLAQNYGQSLLNVNVSGLSADANFQTDWRRAVALSVPEPTTLALLAGLPLLLRRRRRD